MAWPIDIINDLSHDKFSEIFSVNPRSVREALFSRLGIKAQKRRIGIRVGDKNTDRVRMLYQRLTDEAGKMERELAGELLRNWLYTQRPLLCDALDFFEIKHDNGLTEQEIDFFEELEEDKAVGLCNVLVPKHGKELTAIYLRYLKVPKAMEIMAKVPDDKPPEAEPEK